ncbi:MAG: glycerol kinase, partial [Thermotogaceae bacterium]|nr:glycerol kinase [Thermotogaceae bacterium]
MSRDLVMAIDIGSTGTKVICVDASGSIVASANTPIDSFSPRDGWVEHDPIQLWDSVVNCLGEIRNNVSSSRVAAVGITNQRETTVIWDRKTGAPVYNAISWQCKRSAEICKKYEHLEAEIERKTGSLLDAYYS